MYDRGCCVWLLLVPIAGPAGAAQAVTLGGDELTKAVELIDVEGVEALLAAGADPNAVRGAGGEESYQPDRPLKMAMFRLSDCMLTEDHLSSLAQITRMLLVHGADPCPAMEIAESRYGEFPTGDAANDVYEAWKVVAQVAAERTAAATAADSQVITGWINASDRRAFNALHDHGTTVWSLVYFVDAGSPAEEQRNCTEGQVVAPGSLLLRTQMVPFTHQYGFLAVEPQPGELWAFPGKVLHVAASVHALIVAPYYPLDLHCEQRLLRRLSFACSAAARCWRRRCRCGNASLRGMQCAKSRVILCHTNR